MTKVERKKEYSRILLQKNGKVSKKDKEFMWDEFQQFYYDLEWLNKHKGLRVGKHSRFDNVCFFVKNKKTKVWVEIGTSKLLSANPKRDRINHTLRLLINDQVKAVRMDANEVGNTQLHVDHIYAFWKLVRDWVKKENISFDNLYHLVNSTGEKFTNSDINLSWVLYHADYATMEMLPIRDNLKKGGR